MEILSKFEENLPKYKKFSSWVIWYPDLFLDLLKPQEGGINLNTDQRVFLRSATRFFSMYGCFTRGWGKTFCEFLAMIVVAIKYPNIELSLTAQTRENAVKLLKDKYNEVLRQYPILQNEIVKSSFTRDTAEIVLKNGARIDALANSQTSKGLRRKRINIEESVLMDNETFEDALKPVVEVPRYTCGKLAIVNPEELNQQINFFTTPGWRGSDEFNRSLRMIKSMINLDGEIVLGADWKLGCWYGRGSSKSQILQKKQDMSPIAFAQNYGGKWTGSSTGALVNINKLINCRKLNSPILKPSHKGDEYYIGVDVARSENTANNQSSVMVIKANRNKENNRISSLDLVNLFNISNTLNFTEQAIFVKRIKRNYNAKMVIVDGNGLGAGLVDELLKETIDPLTGESLGCWDTVNTDNKPEMQNAEPCLFDLKAQSFQSKIITVFIDMVDSGRLRLLKKRESSDVLIKDENDIETKIAPYVQTDLLIEEISNLKLRHLTNGLGIEKVVKRLNKDRFSALSYVLFYINEFESQSNDNTGIDISQIIGLTRKPKIHRR